MGARDHSATCEKCGCQRGGLNDLRCLCDSSTTTAKETVSRKTMLVERDRTHYARSHGDTEWARVDEPLGVDLGLPASYARDLCAALRRVIAAGDEFDQAQIAVDLPVRLHLRPTQVEQLVEKLAEITERSR